MATKKITDLTLRSDFDDTCNLPADDASQTWRVTAAQIKTWAKAWLSGDFVAPTVQKFTSGSGTYTTPAGVKWIRVRMVGAGGGGGGGGTSTTNAATAGGNTTFGTTLLVANGGSAGVQGAAVGAGGTVSLGTGPIGTAIQGGRGESGNANNLGAYQVGGNGGVCALGGGGGGGFAAANGSAAIANSGSGGGGGGSANSTSNATGSGGSAGGFVDAIISSPASTYAYVVGAKGDGAVGSTSNGGDGGSGYIEVTEYYQ